MLNVNLDVEGFKVKFKVVFQVLGFLVFWKVVKLTYIKILQVFELKGNGALGD
jgi:hypothetical protein